MQYIILYIVDSHQKAFNRDNHTNPIQNIRPTPLTSPSLENVQFYKTVHVHITRKGRRRHLTQYLHSCNTYLMQFKFAVHSTIETLAKIRSDAGRVHGFSNIGQRDGPLRRCGNLAVVIFPSKYENGNVRGGKY